MYARSPGPCDGPRTDFLARLRSPLGGVRRCASWRWSVGLFLLGAPGSPLGAGPCCFGASASTTRTPGLVLLLWPPLNCTLYGAARGTCPAPAAFRRALGLAPALSAARGSVGAGTSAFGLSLSLLISVLAGVAIPLFPPFSHRTDCVGSVNFAGPFVGRLGMGSMQAPGGARQLLSGQAGHSVLVLPDRWHKRLQFNS